MREQVLWESVCARHTVVRHRRMREQVSWEGGMRMRGPSSRQGSDGGALAESTLQGLSCAKTLLCG